MRIFGKGENLYNMQIINLKLDDLKFYKNNAKKHTPEQIQHIKNSIKKFGMNDPVGIWGENNEIVEGHGRIMALKELGVETVDCIRLDHLTDEERRAYMLTHNQTQMETGFDIPALNIELEGIFDIDMTDFGFILPDAIELEDNPEQSVKDYAEIHKCPKCGFEFN